MSASDPISLGELGRLIRILGLLGSDHEGERAAAALKASEWVKTHETSWEMLLTPPDEPNPVVAVGVGYPETPVRPPPGAASGSPHWNWNFTSTPPQTPHSGLGGAPPPTTTGPQLSWQACARIIQAHHTCSQREADFITSILAKAARFPALTPKQDLWFRDICARCGLSY